MATNKQLTNVTHSRQIYLLVTVNTTVRIRTITDVHLPYTVGEKTHPGQSAHVPLHGCTYANNLGEVMSAAVPAACWSEHMDSVLQLSIYIWSVSYLQDKLSYKIFFFPTSHPHKVLASNFATSVLRKKSNRASDKSVEWLGTASLQHQDQEETNIFWSAPITVWETQSRWQQHQTLCT